MKGRTLTKRGNVAITALSLTALLGFSALTIDVAYVRVVDAQFQAAVEAGVLSGVGYLDGTAAGAQKALEKAHEIASANPIFGGVELDEDAFRLGTWSEGGGFSPRDAPTTNSDAGEINAIHVAAEYSGIPAILAGVAFQRSTLSSRAEALAVRQAGGPAAEVECYLPLALPDCAFPSNPTSNPPPLVMKFNNQNVKNIGWAHPDGANASNLKNHLETPDLCGTSLRLGENLPVMNGVVSSAAQRITWTLNGTGDVPPRSWPYEYFPEGPPNPRNEAHHAFSSSRVTSGNWGNVLAGPIALVDMGGGPGSCAGNGQAPSKFTGSKKITGFVWGFIYDQKNAGGANQHLYLRVDFTHDHALGTRSDPNSRGNVMVESSPPKLVRP